MRRAKIVATLGPATESYEMIRAIIEAGVDVTRMNLSHGSYAEHEVRFANVRKAADDAGRAVAILVDLQGPKIRLGKFSDGPHDLAVGETFRITTDDVVGTRDLVGTTFKGLAGDVKPGDFLLIDDGKVRVQVESVDGPVVTTKVIVAGTVSNNKGINLPGVAVSVPALSEKDEADLRWGLKAGADLIALSFVRDAADIFRGVYDATGGVDGRVSIEVSPDLAHDTDGTIAEAKKLWAKVDRPNALIKIPATKAGLPAITAVIAEGISVNVTLIFSLERYEEVIDAYLAGLEQAAANGHDLSGIHSVASFFVSRVDTEVDKRLSAFESEDAEALKSRAGLANARLAYELFEKKFSASRAQELVSAGATVQRPLWASTGVKDPALPDTLYVTELVAPGTVNTMPEKTLEATFDHGVVTGDTVTGAYEDAHLVFAQLADLGVDITDVTQTLEDEGVAKFIASWQDLKKTVAEALAEAPETSR